jgi:hypothetical protein
MLRRLRGRARAASARLGQILYGTHEERAMVYVYRAARAIVSNDYAAFEEACIAITQSPLASRGGVDVVFDPSLDKVHTVGPSDAKKVLGAVAVGGVVAGILAGNHEGDDTTATSYTSADEREAREDIRHREREANKERRHRESMTQKQVQANVLMGRDPRSPMTQATLLHVAVNEGRWNMVQLLCEKFNANLYIQANGKTAAALAMEHQALHKCLRILMSNGLQPDKAACGTTTLFELARSAFPEAMPILKKS